MRVRPSALRAGRPLPPRRRFLVLPRAWWHRLKHMPSDFRGNSAVGRSVGSEWCAILRSRSVQRSAVHCAGSAMSYVLLKLVRTRLWVIGTCHLLPWNIQKQSISNMCRYASVAAVSRLHDWRETLYSYIHSVETALVAHSNVTSASISLAQSSPLGP
jgi:hypothetical protein